MDKKLKKYFNFMTSSKSKNNMERILALLVPLVAVVLALLVSSLLLLFIKVSPIKAYSYLIFDNFTSIYKISEVFAKAAPIIMTGLAFTFAYKAGLFNIGGEGQMFMGAVAAVFVGLHSTNLNPFIAVTLSLIAAIIAGGIWGAIPGLLKAFFNASEIITTIMMNYIAIYFVSLMVDKPLREASGFYPQTDLISNTAFLPILLKNTRFHLGIIIAIVFAIVIYIVIKKTPFGYKLRAVGYNSQSAEYAGINIKTNMMIALAISGALAGIAGFTEINGIHHRLLDNFSSGVGFDGIAASLLGRGNPIGVIISALLLGMLKTGASAMQRGVGVPANVVSIIQALIIIFVLSGNILLPKIELYFANKGGRI
ncbi:ABC transporter permease [Helicovermis profundi]|uniref:ABC transporter permease n=1 Tax=Helicovermis profundi TaxID=3065157 RepID=A0AAU9E9L6_9FIRM|nr:ABC transporter permease [Clostridia bacterium S502]